MTTLGGLQAAPEPSVHHDRPWMWVRYGGRLDRRAARKSENGIKSTECDKVSHLAQWRLRSYKRASSLDSIETETRWSPNMLRRKSPLPVIGCAFDPEQNNTQENFRAIACELRYYRPRGFSDLAR